MSREYSTPLFEPHVTLLGRLTGSEDELLFKTQQLAACLPPFEIRLTEASCVEEFYRALIVRVVKTQPLICANDRARAVFGRMSDAPYSPHLSLLYGDLTRSVKEEILDQIGRRFNQTFPVRAVHLVSTTGETRDWCHAGKFRLAAAQVRAGAGGLPPITFVQG